MPWRQILCDAFTLQSGPLWPRDGCWSGLKPGSSIVEAGRLKRTRLVACFALVGNAVYCAGLCRWFLTSDVPWQSEIALIALSSKQVVASAIWLKLIFCNLGSSGHDFRHLVYAMFFLHAFFTPIIAAVQDSASMDHIPLAIARRFTAISGMMIFQMFTCGQAAVRSFIWIVPGNMLYMVKCCLQWRSLAGNSFSNVAFSFPILCWLSIYIGLLPWWWYWLRYSSVAARAPAKVAPGLPEDAVLPSRAGAGGIAELSDALATNHDDAYLGEDAPPQNFWEQSATPGSGGTSPDQEFYDPSQAAAPAAIAIQVAADFQRPPESIAEPDVECHFHDLAGQDLTRHGFNAGTKLGDMQRWVCNELAISRYETRLIHNQEVFTCQSEECLCDLGQLGHGIPIQFLVLLGQSEVQSDAGSTTAACRRPPQERGEIDVSEIMSTCTIETDSTGYGIDVRTGLRHFKQLGDAAPAPAGFMACVDSAPDSVRNTSESLADAAASASDSVRNTSESLADAAASASDSVGNTSEGLTVCVWLLSGKLVLKSHFAAPDLVTVDTIAAEVSHELHVPCQRLRLHLHSEKLCVSTRLSALSSRAGIGGTLDIQATVVAPQSSPYPTLVGLTQPPLAPIALHNHEWETSSDCSRASFRQNRKQNLDW